MNPIPINTASVKVMRSHDYCHFEVVLGCQEGPISDQEVDELRKRAARLADKAVEQYKVAKKIAQRLESLTWNVTRGLEDAQRIEAINETERTPEQQAQLKAWNDLCFQKRHCEDYDYQDDWQDDED